MKYAHVIGLSFGNLTVVEHAGEADKMLCLCSCGTEKVARLAHLRYGSVKSCGCLLKTTPKIVHGRHMQGHTRAYKHWSEMVRRCTNPNSAAYEFYGARGITVCAEWLGDAGFFKFCSEMGPRPTGLSLDRRDNDVGYSKDNCYWATPVQQSNNRRSSVYLTANGETMTVAQWTVKTGMSKNTIHERLNRGWSAEDAVNKPRRLLRHSPN